MLVHVYDAEQTMTDRLNMLKQLCRYASLNHNIYIVAESTPVDADWTRAIALCVHNVYSANHDDPPTLTSLTSLTDHVRQLGSCSNIPRDI